MCDNAVDTCPFVFGSVLAHKTQEYKTQEFCDKVVSKELFILKFCCDRNKTQKMCNKAVDAYLSALKFVRDWSVTSNMFEIYNDVVFSNRDIDLDYIDSDIIVT